jgi:phage shock protein PspC (stress-responsive transcriptional regulator)
MTDAQPNLFTRPDTFFGVCEGLGEDLRIHPNLLRLALATLLFFNPPAAAAAYAAAGALVLVTRYFFPNPRIAAEAPALEQAEAAPAPREKEAVAERELERLAA